MADIENLSKDELIALLKKGKTVDTYTSELCAFRPTRQNQPPCPKDPVVYYGTTGYCTAHSKTVQAQNVKREYELSKAQVDEPMVEEGDNSLVEARHSSTSGSSEEEPPQKPTPRKEVQRVPPRKEVSKPAPPPPAKKRTTLTRNKWGNYEESETRIVFNSMKKAAFGVQCHKTGDILPLQAKHIALCKKNGWSYIVDETSSEEEEESEEEVEEDEEEEDENSEEESEVENSDEEEEETEEEEESEESDRRYRRR